MNELYLRTRNDNIKKALQDIDRNMGLCSMGSISKQVYEKAVSERFFGYHLNSLLAIDATSPCRDMNGVILSLKRRPHWKIGRVFYNGATVQYDNDNDRIHFRFRLRWGDDAETLSTGLVSFNGMLMPGFGMTGSVEKICDSLDSFCREDLPAFIHETDEYYEKLMVEYKVAEIMLSASKHALTPILKESGFDEGDYRFILYNDGISLKVCGRKYWIYLNEKNLPHKLEILSELIREFGVERCRLQDSELR